VKTLRFAAFSRVQESSMLNLKHLHEDRRRYPTECSASVIEFLGAALASRHSEAALSYRARCGSGGGRHHQALWFQHHQSAIQGDPEPPCI